MTDQIRDEEPQAIPIQPVPTTFGWNPVFYAGIGGLVMLSASTPTGTQSYFLPPALARAMAEGLVNAADAADKAVAPAGAAGIIVPDVDVSEVLRSIGNGKPKR
jgi:hypothetical protein